MSNKNINSNAIAIDLPLPKFLDRQAQQDPICEFGCSGLCCRNCSMGPCKISLAGKTVNYGICGADAELIVSGNFGRMIAGGTAVHSNYGRNAAKILYTAATEPQSDYTIKDVTKLNKIAQLFGILIEGRTKEDIAKDVALKSMEDFGRQDGELLFLKRAPEARQEIWRKLGIVPRGIDREIAEMMHRTAMGAEHDYKNLMMDITRTALADGWGGSMIAAELQDIIFGTPSPVKSKVDIGVLSKTEVNIIIHGHDPVISEFLVKAVKDQGLLALAKSKGVSGINLTGISCTAGETLFRYGIPAAGSILQEELAIATGAVDVITADAHSIMPALVNICKSCHTKLIITSYKGRIDTAEKNILYEGNGYESAKNIVKTAILNFEKRGKVDIPNKSMEIVTGFSNEAIKYMLGGKFKGSYMTLIENIVNGRIRGVVGLFGCSTPNANNDSGHVNLAEELIANDILVIQTGCSVIASARAGLLMPEAAAQRAGKGLAEVCAAVGMPPVLHSGSSVDNSRLLTALSDMVTAAGLKDISDLPVAAAAPEWMSEKDVVVGQYFVASGLYTVFGGGLPIYGSEKLSKFMFEEFEEIFGGMWAVEKNSGEMAGIIIDQINKKRDKLGISKGKERVLFDMEMRRGLEV